MLKQRIRISIVTTPGQVRTIDVTHGGAATEEFTVRSLSIRQRYGAGLVQRTLNLKLGREQDHTLLNIVGDPRSIALQAYLPVGHNVHFSA